MNRLNETQHVPEFLNSFREEICQKVIEETSQKLSKGEDVCRVVVYPTDNTFVECIFFSITFNQGRYNDSRKFIGGYLDKRSMFDGERFNICQIAISVPVSTGNGGIAISHEAFKVVIEHELDHVFWDWKERLSKMKKGKPPIPVTSRTDVSAVNTLYKSNNPLLYEIGALAYLTMKCEENAFSSTLFTELKIVSLDKENYQTTSRQTTYYRTMHETFLKFKEHMNLLTEKELKEINDTIKNKYKQSGVPCFSREIFNSEEYRDTLIKWGDNLYRSFLKRYDSIVSYYLDTNFGDDIYECLVPASMLMEDTRRNAHEALIYDTEFLGNFMKK